MPQMMPLNWVLMFLSINLIMISLMIILFNFFKPIPPQYLTKKTTPSSTKWSW